MSLEDLLIGLRLNVLGIAGSVLVAATCAFLGVYVVLKRVVFVGVSLAQISSAGIALAFLVGPWLAAMAHQTIHAAPPFSAIGVCFEWLAVRPVVVSLFVTFIAVALFAHQSRSRTLPREASIGIGYVLASALTLLFILRSAKGMDDVRELLDGSVVALGLADLRLMALVFLAVAVIHVLCYKQFLFVSYDAEMAASRGYAVAKWEMLFYTTLGATIAVAIQKAGLLSVFAMMLLPAATGLVACRRMAGVFTIAVVAGVVSAAIGFTLALLWDLPVSPPTIGTSAVLLASAYLLKLRRE